LGDKALQLDSAISSNRPSDHRWRVFDGDCNADLPRALEWLAPFRWAPTFAFLDPKGLQVAWTTVETLAKWRADKRTKVELWILFPEPALARVLGLTGVQGRNSAAKLDRLYGSHDWLAIHQLRRAEEITPDEMRAEFVNLYRWRLEHVLGYKTTHALQLVATWGQPIYTMVFATDSAAGSDIMQHVYGNTAMKTIPEMQARAQAAKLRRGEADRGVMRLFDVHTEATPRRAGSPYDHVPPWEPPQPLSDELELDDVPEEDPDDVDLEKWVDELGWPSEETAP
jgi:three-Cys-motif partner protein